MINLTLVKVVVGLERQNGLHSGSVLGASRVVRLRRRLLLLLRPRALAEFFRSVRGKKMAPIVVPLTPMLLLLLL